MIRYLFSMLLYGFTFPISTFLFSSLAWTMVATFGSLPFLLSAQDFTFSEAFFESMSGITTTGATIIPDLDNSPKSILLWRAIMQWLGGIGIVVMAITILPLLKVGGMQLLLFYVVLFIGCLE